MLAVPDRAPGALFSFVQQWLETEDYTDKPKDPEAYPIFNPQMAEAAGAGDGDLREGGAAGSGGRGEAAADRDATAT